jgi:hypothetical protein
MPLSLAGSRCPAKGVPDLQEPQLGKAARREAEGQQWGQRGIEVREKRDMNGNVEGYNFLRPTWPTSAETFVQQFLKYKYHTEKRLPETWDELWDWLSEFDLKRNELSIQIEKAFREHMETCIHPIILPWKASK